ncbi:MULTISPECIES: hypothetical protein [Methylobacterium]|jgi:hypothetical protein|uniref:Uncharacterized protein n=1 Tax=Methylobacterium longum TaxID=767694 RepID=A0ABT8AMP0_9HYPH|nr:MULTISPECIES: hypothetical protein [Methylobacterium]MCJ2103260.1 hypothetical protein [Methylobacterium sp. E-046]MDN3571054.1 hypothetical protein [Methylobacterium longum]GJE14192.1 hypothetical protein FOHLNKBM_5264 [Methylobacterium longum]
MPTHRCLDPQDPYAEREVRVAFEWVAGQPRLLTALDEQETDILPDLIEAQRDDLRREIVATPRSEFDGVRAATTRGPPATAC